MDFALEYMKKHSIPLTRENYLRLAYGSKVDPSQYLGAELESELPKEIQFRQEQRSASRIVDNK